jgi:CRP-like cAMP-binding protein
MSITSLEPVISQQPFFAGVDAKLIQLIVGCAKNGRFEAGQILFREGDPADQFYLIREGRVAVEAMIPQRGYTTVQTVSAGEVLGWSWLLPPFRWHYDARVMKLARAIVFDGKCLREKCEQNHDLGFEMLKRMSTVIAGRLEATRLQLLDVYGANA